MINRAGRRHAGGNEINASEGRGGRNFTERKENRNEFYRLARGFKVKMPDRLEVSRVSRRKLGRDRYKN